MRKWWSHTPALWITDFDLLTEEDTQPISAAQERANAWECTELESYPLDDNYLIMIDKLVPTACPALQPEGCTARGVKLGASIENVRHAYGVPLPTNIAAELTGTLVYIR